MINKQKINERDEKGNTPLFYTKDINEIKELIELGANVNQINIRRRTPLFKAGFEKSKLLIEYGANLSHFDEGGVSALFFSDAETTKFLIEKGAVVDQYDMEGDTPLSIAASYQDVEKCKILIEAGANIHNTNLSTFTALEMMPKELQKFALDFEKNKY